MNINITVFTVSSAGKAAKEPKMMKYKPSKKQTKKPTSLRFFGKSKKKIVANLG
jgi:hypothetical protein